MVSISWKLQQIFQSLRCFYIDLLHTYRIRHSFFNIFWIFQDEGLKPFPDNSPSNCITKACRVFGQYRRVIGNKWGFAPEQCLWLNEMVLSSLTYGAVMWWSKAQQVTVVQRLNHLQRMALLSLIGACHDGNRLHDSRHNCPAQIIVSES